MKVRNLFFATLASAAVIVGCEEKNPDLGGPSITINPTSLEFSQAGGADDTQTIALTATRDWRVESKPEWVTVSPESGSASADAQTVTITVTANESTDRTGAVKFVAGPVDASLAISQPGAKGSSTSVADFLKAEVSKEVWYTLTGKITNLQAGNYGNFDLVDETGTVYVYGLTQEKREDGKNDQSFPKLGLKDGDIVTLAGQRAEHNGSPQVGGPAYYISHVAGVVEYVEVASIEDVFTTNEKYISVKGVVVAAGKVSYIINDGGDKNLYVYNDSEPEVKVGDVVKVKATKSEYPGNINSGVTIETKMVQLTAPTSEKISENITPKAETALELSETDLATYFPASSQLIKFTATVNVDGVYKNLDLGAGGIGSVVASSLDDEITDGKRLDFTGYYGGRNARGYLNILPTVVAESAAPYINLSEESKDVTAEETSVKFNVSSNSAWTVSVDKEGWTVSPVEGTGDGEVVVSFPANTTQDDVTAVITVSLKDDASKNATFTVKQAGALAEGLTSVIWEMAEKGSSFVEATDETYGAGYAATVNDVTVGYYKHTSTTNAVAPSGDHIRVYKNSVLIVKSDSGAKIKEIIINTTGGEKYCADMTVLSDNSTAVADTGTSTITWKGNVDNFAAQASKAQVRISKLTIVYGE